MGDEEVRLKVYGVKKNEMKKGASWTYLCNFAPDTCMLFLDVLTTTFKLGIVRDEQPGLARCELRAELVACV